MFLWFFRCLFGRRSDNTGLELNCWIVGQSHSRAFTLTLETTATISQLKIAIKKAKEPEFDHIPADLLSIWKVKLTKDVLETKFALFTAADDVEGATPLARPLISVGEVFDSKSTPARHIHVIVQRPATDVGKLLVHHPIDLR